MQSSVYRGPQAARHFKGSSFDEALTTPQVIEACSSDPRAQKMRPARAHSECTRSSQRRTRINIYKRARMHSGQRLIRSHANADKAGNIWPAAKMKRNIKRLHFRYSAKASAK